MTKKELLRIIDEAAATDAMTLHLEGHGIEELPPEIGKLEHLRELFLTGNKLTTLPPEIGNLQHLTSLVLSANKLTTLPPEIGNLQHLTSLVLSANKLTTLPPEIGNLLHLTYLDVAGNKLTALPSEIGKLEQLRELLLTGNKLTTLPPEIGKLTHLTFLMLSENQLTALLPEIGNLHRLKKLFVWTNGLTTLPSEIGNLRALDELRVYSNRLTTLPPEIAALEALRTLWLEGNQLTTLPPELGQLKNLRDLNVSDNPLTDPPPEVVEQGTQAILEYLRGKLDESKKQWVSKLLAVGEGGVGKTCMLEALRGNEFNADSESTHGILVEPLEVTHPTEKGVTMTLNCWDFGGQEIYHATHQFFLSNRSLFLLVWNARPGFEQGKLFYWLNTIKALAPDSPILIVATHIDQRDAVLPIDDLQRRHPQVLGRHEISSKNGEGIEALRTAIAEAASHLPLMGNEWPAAWSDAAEEIKARPEHHITANELRSTMSKQKVTGAAQQVLGRSLHELGYILHFDTDEELKDTVLLDPRWVTRNISNVLECEQIIDGLGIFRREHMDVVWQDLDPGLHDRFLRLMERFDLSYRIPDDPENKSLIVERLSLDPPDYEAQWEAIRQHDTCREISMKFDLQSTRPAGIPTWFIARTHRFTTHTHWRYGALFADGPERRHLALAVAPPSERWVMLTVRGPSPYSFFALLKDGLELTLRRFPGLNIKRTMPCPGHNDKPCDHAFDYSHLQNAIECEPPVFDIQCPVRFKNVSVPKLLFGIHWSQQDAVLDRIDELEQASAQRHDETMTELGALRELTQREFTNLFNRDQRLAESHCPCVFTLRPAGKKRWPALDKILGVKWELQLYCEAPGSWHPTKEGGRYEIKKPGEWASAVAPHLQRLVKVFKFVAPLAGPWLAYAAPAYAELLKTDVDLMKALVEKLPDLKVDQESQHALLEERAMRGKHETGLSRLEGASLRGLRRLLDHLDKDQVWGGLNKILTPEGHYLWLCDHHAKEYEV